MAAERLKGVLLVFLLLLLSVPFAYAQSAIEEIPDNLIKGTLQAAVIPTSVVCSDTPCVVSYNVTATNPSGRAVRLFVAEKENSSWRIILELGNLSSGESASFDFVLNFIYTGQTDYVGQYAIVTDNLLKSEFSISENWGNYEDKAKEFLKVGGFVVAPIIALVIIIILYFAAKIAERRQYVPHPGEFTMQTLFAIPTRGTLSERVATFLANPIFWGVVLFLAFLLMASLITLTYQGIDMVVLVQIALISLVTAALIPLVLMLLSWFADYYDRDPLRFVVGMFIWGMLSAFLTFFISGAVVFLFSRTADTVPILFVSVFGSLLISPVVEEIIKAIGIAIIAQRHEFDDTLDGLLYGFAIGLGFAMMENWFYFIARVDPLTVGVEAWFSAILYRSFFNTIAHGCFTAFVGAIVGMAKSKRRFREYFIIAIFPAVFVAIILHIIFNFTAYLDIIAIAQYRTVVILFNPILVVTIVAGVLAVYVFALIENRNKYGRQPKALELLTPPQ